MQQNHKTDSIIEQLFAAELQFRLAYSVEFAIDIGKQPLGVPKMFSYGHHTVEDKEIYLRQEQAIYAVRYLVKSATFLLATEIKNALVSYAHPIKDFKNYENKDIRNAFQIVRYIRNAFTHAPFRPVWYIDPVDRNKVFALKDIIKFDTAGLNGQEFNWQNYGGPLAILRLAHFVRFEILKDSAKQPKDRDLPKLEHQ